MNEQLLEPQRDSQARGVDELRVRLLPIQSDQLTQVPHGLLQEGVLLKNARELAHPLPCPRSRTQNMLVTRKGSQRTSSRVTRCPFSPDEVADLGPPEASLVRGTVLIGARKRSRNQTEPHRTEHRHGYLLQICIAGAQHKARPVSWSDYWARSRTSRARADTGPLMADRSGPETNLIRTHVSVKLTNISP